MTTRLISVDSHVQVAPERIKANLSATHHQAWDDAVATERAQHIAEMGGVDPRVLAAGFNSEAMAHPGYSDGGERLKAMDRDGGLWVAFPKKASGVVTDMTDHVVREVALPVGLVDNKVCAIDAVWTGVRVVWRKHLR